MAIGPNWRDDPYIKARRARELANKAADEVINKRIMELPTPENEHAATLLAFARSIIVIERAMRK